MSPTVVYIWCGKGSTGDEREMAKKIAAEGKADTQIMAEGNLISSKYLYISLVDSTIFVLNSKHRSRES